MNNDNKDVASGLNRRSFLKTSTGLVLAGAGTMMFPSVAAAKADELGPTQFRGHNSDHKLWKKVRKEFVLNKRTTYMNVGTSGSMPKSILKSYAKTNEMISANPWQSNIPTIELARQVAPGFGADEHELVLSRNTTDGMNSIINGLQFEEGDVVLTTHHEHPGATIPLKHVSERYNVEVVEVEIPVYTGENQVSEDDFVNAFADAVAEYGSRVRLIVFSHVTYTTGTSLPAKRICKEVAIPNRIPTLIDGAHTPGMLNLNFHDIDCDFYSGAGHKWQCGPGATGILYIRDNAQRLAEFWNDRPTPLWCINSSSSSTAIQARFQSIGQDNYPAKQALADACAMWEEIGRDVIEERVLDLSELCKQELFDTFPYANFYAPNIRELSSGLTTFNPFYDQHDGELLTQFRDRLHEEYGYIVRTTSFYNKKDDMQKIQTIRISTHLFHDEDDVIGLVKAMKRLYRNMA
ncbi:aminotransferase class V-fold PLP-dependent enzyme [Shewanella woodyi]|uniref:Aminotransferase class V n=1 Tax=Shewanella woodyi (strain ATCC 51908 / MS32) TaxID=392500 RepID=B1KIN9_SHEWM|nr:aminotransferase class V-fold PLP-dependent enzyme [Shewanella woodyi]ACA88535.1 aminotransferase class V [Shewanella woodyi ATCC 51908]